MTRKKANKGTLVLNSTYVGIFGGNIKCPIHLTVFNGSKNLFMTQEDKNDGLTTLILNKKYIPELIELLKKVK